MLFVLKFLSKGSEKTKIEKCRDYPGWYVTRGNFGKLFHLLLSDPWKLSSEASFRVDPHLINIK